MKIFIPIKNNSQRVPRKNFRIINGEPLYKFQLLKFTDFEVFVDTDSNEVMEGIKEDVRLKNITVFKRNEKLVGDEISVCDLIKDFIIKNDIKDPITQIHVTSPFLNKETLKKAYQFIGEYDSVVACNVHNSRFWRLENYGFCPVNHNPMKLEQTQTLPTLYEENSAFYIFRPKILLETNNRIGINPYFYHVDYPYNVDIDTEEDWQMVLRNIK
jgi:CMP-N-acetylneuraminic acid synthetase